MADNESGYGPSTEDTIASYMFGTEDPHNDEGRFYDDTSDNDTTEIEDSLNSDRTPTIITNNIHNTVIPVPPVRKSCSRCSSLTDDKESTLQCFKCKCYVHYVCSRLPGYMLYLLRTTEFFYVCERCVDAPSDFALFDAALSETKQSKPVDVDENGNASTIMDDINTSLHGLSNSVDSLRTSIPAKNEHMQKSVYQLESKMLSLEKMIEGQLSRWHDDHVTKEKLDGQTLNNAILMEQTIESQEHEIEMLEVVLSDKNLFIEKLIEENKEILTELNSRDDELAKSTNDLKRQKAHSEKLRHVIYKLKHQVKTLQNQERNSVTHRDKKVYELYEKLRDATEIIPRTHDEICRLQKSVNILQDHIQQARTNTHHIRLLRKEDGKTDARSEDVVIVHDALFKYVPNSLENLSIRKIHASTLDDAYLAISRLETKPNVILLHTGTADLARFTEHEMVERVIKIYNSVRARGIKFIFSGIPVRKDQQFDLKVQLFNAMVVSKLSFADGVTICRNDVTTKVYNDEPLHTINLID